MMMSSWEGIGRITPKGIWIIRRIKEIDPEAWADASSLRGPERFSAAFEQALKEFETGSIYKREKE